MQIVYLEFTSVVKECVLQNIKKTKTDKATYLHFLSQISTIVFSFKEIIILAVKMTQKVNRLVQ